MHKTSYRVEHINGCTLIFGSIPIDDLLALTAKAGEDTVVSADLASLTGASFVFGLPADIVRFRQSSSLSLSDARKADSTLALERGIHVNVANWLAVGERGMSSDAMCKALFGIPAGAGADHPYDPDDLSRCIKFLDAACFAGADRLELVGQMRDVSPEWSTLVEHWQELEESFVNERGNRKHLTYEMMERLLDQ